MTRTEQIDARTKAATGRPWRLFDRAKTLAVYQGIIGPERIKEVVTWMGFDGTDFPRKERANATFIANARQDIPWLRAWQDRAKRLIQEARDRVSDGAWNDDVSALLAELEEGE